MLLSYSINLRLIQPRKLCSLRLFLDSWSYKSTFHFGLGELLKSTCAKVGDIDAN